MGQTQSPVIIIGAGLAGLACALTLQEKNQAFLLLEKSDQVGGRIRTFKSSSGFLLDHGFQVLLTSYPELKNFINLEKLDLKYFHSGALIYTPQKLRLLANPMVHPSHLLKESFSQLVSLKDKALVLKLVLQCHTQNSDHLSKISTMEYLKRFGFSDSFIELFWRPFLAGVFLDGDLETDSAYFLFLLKNFSSGRVAVPRLGMQQIPLQMQNKIPSASIRLNASVTSYSKNEVLLQNGESLTAKAVVLAYDSSHTEKDQHTKNKFNSVVNYYFSTPEDLNWDKWLMLVPPQYGFKINNVSVMSNVSQAYSIEGQHLISVSLLGLEDPGEERVIEELKKIAGFDLQLKFVDKYIIQKALPKKFSKNQTHVEDGIYHCGDYLSSPSINGALQSGRMTAEKIISQFAGV